MLNFKAPSLVWQNYRFLGQHREYLITEQTSVVNGFLVCGISFHFGRTNEIRKDYLGTGY